MSNWILHNDLPTLAASQVPIDGVGYSIDDIIRVENNLWSWNGTKWVVLSGEGLIFTLGADFKTTVGATEEILATKTIYPWMLAVGNTIKAEIHAASYSAGTLANRSYGFRLGVTGTISDNGIGLGESLNTTTRENSGIRYRVIGSGGFYAANSNTSLSLGSTNSPNGSAAVVINTSVTNILSLFASTTDSNEPVTIRRANVYLITG